MNVKLTATKTFSKSRSSILKITTLLFLSVFLNNAYSQSDAIASLNTWKPDLRFNKPFYPGFVIAPDTAAAKDTAKEKTMSQKMETLFKYIPVPMYSYSSEGGNLFGLAKFNSFQLSKKDTVSEASILSGVASATTKGR